MPKTSKEAIVIVVDVAGEESSSKYFESCKSCLEMIFQRKMFAESKDDIALVVVGTKESNNPLHKNSMYNHISVVRHLESIDWEIFDMIKTLDGNHCEGNWLEGIIVALDLLKTECRGTIHSSCKVLVITNFNVPVNESSLSKASEGALSMNVDLSIITTFVEDDGVSEEAYKFLKPGEKVAKNLIQTVNGGLFSFEDVIPQLMYFSKKSVSPTPWNVNFEITPEIQIPISGFIKSKASTLKCWKECHSYDDNIPISKERSFQKSDSRLSTLGATQVIQGYKYGKTIIPFNSEDEEALTYKSGERGLFLLGFARISDVKFHHHIGDSVLIVLPRTGNDDAKRSLDALIQGLYEMDMVVIARRVYCRNSSPSVGALYPRVKDNELCLVWLVLPFMEDIRYFSFPSLCKNEKFHPVDSDKDCINELIDHMDLASDSDEKFESLLETLNPLHQHIFQCMLQRITTPGSKLAIPKSPLLTAEQLFPDLPKNLGTQICSLFHLVDNNKRPNEDRDSGTNQPKLFKEDNLVESLVSKDDLLSIFVGSEKMNTSNPVQTFIDIIKKDGSVFLQACKDLQAILGKLVDQSYHGDLDDKIVSCIHAMRMEFIKRQESKHFNDWLMLFKDEILKRNKKDLLLRIISENLGLLSTNEVPSSDLCKDEAICLLNDAEQIAVEGLPDQNDLLEEL